MKLDRHYNVFFAKCIMKNDLLALSSVADWRNRCDVAVCWLSEIFTDQPDRLKAHTHVLQQFDYVLVNMSGSAG
ncbi:MAG: glycosyltransferase family 1 protein, partial [Actinomycetota bacterium]|nr:glycosyltransferase family 1 protein [Actinomycetota bacterium]